MKKGISPLIATVLLVGFTIVMSVFVLVGVSNMGQRTIAEQDKRIATAVVLDFDAKYSPALYCDNWTSEIKCNTNGKYYCVLIENQENREVNYRVITQGSLGSEICSPTNINLTGYESKVFAIGFDENKVGQAPFTADVEAILFLED
ncbi:hypothetical protein J4438_03415 [Candidatus Woesearchaeota archaeon]|nr:hypothetical protein [Candidatus Woesearchaeota archaeon]